MLLSITPATPSDHSIILNLARFYIYDMSEYTGWPFPPDALFDASALFANYFSRPSQPAWPPTWHGYPFLIRMDGHPAGFALIKRIHDSPPTFDMGEFFIARQHRGHGIGRRAAVHLFDQFPGHWEVREMPANKPAQAFWRRIISDYTSGAFTESQETIAAYDGREFVVQRFQSPPANSPAPA